MRWRRMSGYNTVWVPGTDHAGIATQVRSWKAECMVLMQGCQPHNAGCWPLPTAGLITPAAGLPSV